MISLQNIEKVYRTDTVETLAINGINLDIAKGEFLSVMGPSGCGKSTLLNIMGLLDEPSKGKIVDRQARSK
jgi:putative ABC transport system ATP-binding protein